MLFRSDVCGTRDDCGVGRQVVAEDLGDGRSIGLDDRWIGIDDGVGGLDRGDALGLGYGRSRGIVRKCCDHLVARAEGYLTLVFFRVPVFFVVAFIKYCFCEAIQDHHAVLGTFASNPNTLVVGG